MCWTRAVPSAHATPTTLHSPAPRHVLPIIGTCHAPQLGVASGSAAVVKALILEKRERWLAARQPPVPPAPPVVVDPHTLTSAQWLAQCSLAARKLTFYDVIRPYVFRHAMGPQDILRSDADPHSLGSRVVPPATHTR